MGKFFAPSWPFFILSRVMCQAVSQAHKKSPSNGNRPPQLLPSALGLRAENWGGDGRRSQIVRTGTRHRAKPKRDRKGKGDTGRERRAAIAHRAHSREREQNIQENHFIVSRLSLAGRRHTSLLVPREPCVDCCATLIYNPALMVADKDGPLNLKRA